MIAALLVLLCWPAAAAPDPARGRAAIEAAECTRCHEIPGIELAPVEASCVGCHRAILAAAATPEGLVEARARYPYFDRHHAAVARGHFTQGVPSLVATGRRLRPAWVRAFLAAPWDVRPHLSESMVRVGFDAATLDDVVAFLVADAAKLSAIAPPAADPALIAAGEALFRTRACPACHLTGARVFPEAGEAALTPAPIGPRALAPDLLHVRERFRGEALVPWLLDPKALKADTAMPPTGFTPAEARAVAAFLLYAPMQASAPVRPMPAKLPSIAKAPNFTEVDERIFSRWCIHCHMDPAPNGGDGGVGYGGGLGWPARRLSFDSYDQLKGGSVAPDGSRVDVLARRGAEPPLLLDRLRRRHTEVLRDRVRPGEDGRLAPPAPEGDPAGMPLGLPALSAEELALVEAWLAAGAPGPAKGRSGRASYYGGR